MKQIIVLLSLIFYSLLSIAQTVSGNLSQLRSQEIKLEGFKGFTSYPISTASTDQEGNFTLRYSSSDYGIGYLITSDQKPFFVILSGEDIFIKGESIASAVSIKILSGKENQLFECYSLERGRREQALSAWTYLEKLYSSDSLFTYQRIPLQNIKKEKTRINQEELKFLKSLPEKSYVKWYLPARKWMSAVSTIAQYRPEEIPETVSAFRNLDYTDPRLYKSGLLRDAVEGHYWLLENSGLPLDSAYKEMQKSTDVLLSNLKSDEKKLNEVTNHLFEFLEKRSLFAASEYLALKVLNEVGCTIEPDLARQLESYRAMKKGSIAADFSFAEDTWAPGYAKAPAKLSDVPASYTVVVFGASWCPQCTEEIPTISQKYSTWKQKGVEVIFVSLDVDKDAFKTFSKDFPFISTCDYKKWDGNTVNSYYVFATPTLFLLDRNRGIILRPNNVQQLDSWILGNL